MITIILFIILILLLSCDEDEIKEIKEWLEK